MNELPKVVFSNTLQEPLAWGNTRLVRGDLAEQVRALKQQSADPLRSIGSITLVKSMLHLGLVDRLRMTIFPLLLGDAGREPTTLALRGPGLSCSGPQCLTPGLSWSNTGLRPARRANQGRWSTR